MRNDWGETFISPQSTGKVWTASETVSRLPCPPHPDNPPNQSPQRQADCESEKRLQQIVAWGLLRRWDRRFVHCVVDDDFEVRPLHHGSLSSAWSLPAASTAVSRIYYFLGACFARCLN